MPSHDPFARAIPPGRAAVLALVLGAAGGGCSSDSFGVPPCRTDRGTVQVHSNVEGCPTITSFEVLPTVVAVGGSVSLHATASVPLGGIPQFSWTATSGTFSDPASSSPTFTCTMLGIAKLTLTVSHDGCSAIADGLSVTCAPPETGGVSVSGASGTAPAGAAAASATSLATNAEPTADAAASGDETMPPSGSSPAAEAVPDAAPAIGATAAPDAAAARGATPGPDAAAFPEPATTAVAVPDAAAVPDTAAPPDGPAGPADGPGTDPDATDASARLTMTPDSTASDAAFAILGTDDAGPPPDGDVRSDIGSEPFDSGSEATD